MLIISFLDKGSPLLMANWKTPASAILSMIDDGQGLFYLHLNNLIWFLSLSAKLRFFQKSSTLPHPYLAKQIYIVYNYIVKNIKYEG